MKKQTAYVNSKIHYAMIVALIAMEVALCLYAIAYLYADITQIVEKYTYSIHINASLLDAYVEIFFSIIYVSSILLLVNLIAVIFAAVLWSVYVKYLLKILRRNIDRMNDLEFAAYNKRRALHPIMNLLANWHNAKKDQCQNLETEIKVLARKLNQE